MTEKDLNAFAVLTAGVAAIPLHTQSLIELARPYAHSEPFKKALKDLEAAFNASSDLEDMLKFLKEDNRELYRALLWNMERFNKKECDHV